MKTIVVLGASDKPERYSNKVVRLLAGDSRYRVVPVHPTLQEIEGVPVVSTLADAPRDPDLLTIYVNPTVSTELADDIVALRPHVVIFNPGTKNPSLELMLHEASIGVIYSCTVTIIKNGGIHHLFS